jgi:hypothetical protein
MPIAARNKNKKKRKAGPAGGSKARVKSKARTRLAARATPKGKAQARKPTARPAPTRAAAKPSAKPPSTPARPAPAPPAAVPPLAKGAGKGPARSGASGPGPAPAPRPAGAKKSARRSALQRRPGFVPGDLLLPTGPQTPEELLYYFRGCAAAAHPAVVAGVDEVLAKRGQSESAEARTELAVLAQTTSNRFETGNIDGQLPNRPLRRPVFAGVIERAKARRREIGAFLRGLDLGRTEASHMDSHGEASMQSLMEWAARLENLAEADEPEQADYAQFHRGLDQLDNTTEALVVDVELTLRRMRDRVR